MSAERPIDPDRLKQYSLALFGKLEELERDTSHRASQATPPESVRGG